MDCTTRSQLRVDPVVRWSFEERVKLILLRLNKQTLARPDIAGQWFNFMNCASQVRQVSRAAFSRLTSGYEDFDKTAQTITKLGGEVALPKFAVPGLCWQGYFRDTENNVFGIFQVDEQASNSPF